MNMPMRATRLTLTVLFICFFALTGTACAKKVQLHSQPVVDAFGNVPPVSITLNGSGAAVAEARDIPVIVAAYGSGYDIHVDLMLIDPQAPATRAELARAAMAAALTLYRMVHADPYDDEDRPIRASVYQTYTAGYEYNVLLGTALFDSKSNDPRDFTFPGPAWKEVAAAERIATDQELAYIQQAQLKRYDWGYHDLEKRQEDLRGIITPAQDAEVSAELGIKPGTVNLAPLVLKPLGERLESVL